jgi:potassium channel subfamily K
VPTLTILISDMGDTVVAVFSSVTVWLESPTLLPGEQSLRSILNRITRGRLSRLDTREKQSQKEKTTTDEKDEDSETSMMDRIADRMAKHLEAQELQDALRAEHEGDTLDRDIHFYHFILARETQRMMKDLNATPPKRYEWGEWEYFLKLMANDYDSDELTGNQLIPEELRLPETREQWTRKQNDHRWSWLSSRSPLMGSKTSETEWILERLGACLEHELRESRLLPYRKREEKRKPPVSMADMVRRGRIKQREDYGVAQVEARQEA